MKKTEGRAKSYKIYSIITIISVLLVSCGAGLMSSILAYFTDSAEIENVFTIGSVDIELIEKAGDALYSTTTNDDITVNGNTVKGIANITPGKNIPKKPYIQNKGKNDAWAYMEVKIPIVSINGVEKELFTYTEPSGNWAKVEDFETTEDSIKYKVYRYKYTVKLDGTPNGTPVANGITTALFDSVTVINEDWTPEDLAGLATDVQMVKVSAYAIQTEEVTVDEGYSKFFPEVFPDLNKGDYVNIGTSILASDTKLADDSTIKSDWRVFKKDRGGVWLILADYMPNTAFDVTTVGLVKGTGNYATYGVISNTDRTTLINGLKHTSWSNLINGSRVEGKAGVQVKGALDLPTWVESWNDNEGYTELNAEYHSASEIDGSTVYAEGYKINGDFYAAVENSNTLYFPQTSAKSNCYGYWLASPSAANGNYVLAVDYYGRVIYGHFDAISIGVRPAVYLPSNIQLNDVEGVWTAGN